MKINFQELENLFLRTEGNGSRLAEHHRLAAMPRNWWISAELNFLLFRILGQPYRLEGKERVAPDKTLPLKLQILSRELGEVLPSRLVQAVRLSKSG